MNQKSVYPSFDTSNASQYDQSVSVVIVGAGPTGLTAANLLGLAGIDTLVVERNAGLSDVPKAIALDDEGLRICQAMDLSTTISKCILSDINAHYISAGRLLAKVAPTSRKNGYSLISTFYQPEFEATLLHGLNRFPNVTVRFQHTVEALEQTNTAVIVSIRSPQGTLQQVKCSYLLACDGGRSTIRHALGISMQGTAAAQKWLVVDCIADEEPSSIVKFFCNPHRPAVTVPSPNNGRRWEFMLLPGETEKDLLKAENISTLIQQATGSPPSPSMHIIRQTIYTFHSTLAKSFSKGRIFLLGDAAHMMPPFGGQGLNSGLRDAHNLTWKLSMVLQGQASPLLLATYHQERYTHVAQMIHFSSFLGNIFMSTKKPVAFSRNIVMHLLNRLPPIREFLTEGRIKPHPEYKTGFLLPHASKEAKAMAGLLLPQPEVITMQGNRVLLDDILGPGFALLRLHHNPREAFASLKTDFWQRLGARFVCITINSPGEGTPFGTLSGIPAITSPPERVPLAGALANTCAMEGLPVGASLADTQPPAHPLSDTDNPLSLTIVRSADTNFLRTKEDLFIVVRPDRYIFGVFKEEKADTFISAFQRELELMS